MEKKFILAHDIGTSSDKAVLVDFKGRIVATARCSYETYYPNPSWVEQKPEDYWAAVCDTSNRLVKENNIDPKEIKGIVFTTQAMGLIPVDSEGNTLYNNITWVDGRAEKQAQAIMRKFGGKKLFTAIVGTPIMGKDVIPKMRWLKDEHPEIFDKTKYFLDVNGYLKMKCTGRMVAELSGASSYGLHLKKNIWLPAMKIIGMDMSKLPPLVKSTDNVGGMTAKAAEETGLYEGLPVFGGSDDVQSAAIGSGMNKDEDIHIYLGTSAWVCAMSKTHTKFINGAAAIKSADPDMNIIVGITEAAGSNIQWLVDQFFKSEKEKHGDGIYAYMDKVIEKIPPGSDSLICTPWMLGERCPVSTTTTRATLFNINAEHTREHLMRAIYEGIGYNLRWILENFRKDYGFSCNTFRIIGGGALDKGWMQIIADITGVEFKVVKDPRNAGALGGAIIALIGLKEIESFEKASEFVEIESAYTPDPGNKAVYDKLYLSYKDIYYGLKDAYIRANSERFGG
ncbi:MAG: xylulokinase [Christensenellales bacterium]|jgi:xylulokinase